MENPILFVFGCIEICVVADIFWLQIKQKSFHIKQEV